VKKTLIIKLNQQLVNPI